MLTQDIQADLLVAYVISNSARKVLLQYFGGISVMDVRTCPVDATPAHVSGNLLSVWNHTGRTSVVARRAMWAITARTFALSILVKMEYVYIRKTPCLGTNVNALETLLDRIAVNRRQRYVLPPGGAILCADLANVMSQKALIRDATKVPETATAKKTSTDLQRPSGESTVVPRFSYPFKFNFRTTSLDSSAQSLTCSIGAVFFDSEVGESTKVRNSN